MEAAAAKLDAVSGKMQSLERNILQYAEKLGLTPSGRVRLAQKRAQAAAGPGRTRTVICMGTERAGREQRGWTGASVPEAVTRVGGG